MNQDIVRYNAAAKDVMARHGVAVLDFYKMCVDHCGTNFTSCDWHESHATPMWKALAAEMAPILEHL